MTKDNAQNHGYKLNILGIKWKINASECKSLNLYILSFHLPHALISYKVEAPITHNLRVLAKVQRLHIQMNIFPLCRNRK